MKEIQLFLLQFSFFKKVSFWVFKLAYENIKNESNLQTMAIRERFVVVKKIVKSGVQKMEIKKGKKEILKTRK